MDQFMRGVAIGVQASPEISFLVVGGVRLLCRCRFSAVSQFNMLGPVLLGIADC
jgi:hypothetical protein